MNNRFILVFTLLMFLLTGIQVNASEFEVTTTPAKAEVFIASETSGEPVKLGNTPLKLTSDEVFSQVKDSKAFVLTVKKEGFDPYRLMIVKTPDVDYKMDILLTVSGEVRTIKKHDLLMSELFKAQRMIRAGNLSDALNKLTELEKDNKGFSIISEMKAIAYYMKKDLNAALSMYREAFSKNHKNQDAYKMKVYLEKKLGLEAEIN